MSLGYEFQTPVRLVSRQCRWHVLHIVQTFYRTHVRFSVRDCTVLEDVMSAGAVGVFVPQPVRMPSRTVHPRLRLVDSGERVGADERTGLGARPSGVRTEASSSQAIRLTRWGRLVMTLMAALAVTILAVAVATTQLPSLPIHNAVARIQLANGLSSSQVHAGQLLLIPKLH